MKGKIIVAMTIEGGIGMDGSIPWRIPGDMQFFKRETQCAPEGKKNVVIMGKNTWDSINRKPLASRFNIVVSKTLFEAESEDGAAAACVKIVPSFKEAVHFVEECMKDECYAVYAIGGARIYLAALQHPLFTECIVTQITKPNFVCDTYFPLSWATKHGWHFGLGENKNSSIQNENGIEYMLLKLTKS
jgi:dihydrofolate reductase